LKDIFNRDSFKHSTSRASKLIDGLIGRNLNLALADYEIINGPNAVFCDLLVLQKIHGKYWIRHHHTETWFGRYSVGDYYFTFEELFSKMEHRLLESESNKHIHDQAFHENEMLALAHFQKVIKPEMDRSSEELLPPIPLRSRSALRRTFSKKVQSKTNFFEKVQSKTNSFLKGGGSGSCLLPALYLGYGVTA